MAMKRTFATLMIICTLCCISHCQSYESPSPSKDLPDTWNPKLQNRLTNILSFKVPIISVDSLYENLDNFLLLDAREIEEYEVSHLSNARHIGYKKPNYSVLDGVDKNQTIAIYCTVGYRSEKIGQNLIKRGYTNIYNVFGSIAEWVNHDYPLENDNGRTTKVHTYNKKWSQWFNKGSHVY